VVRRESGLECEERHLRLLARVVDHARRVQVFEKTRFKSLAEARLDKLKYVQSQRMQEKHAPTTESIEPEP
jgi:hypothetical protein